MTPQQFEAGTGLTGNQSARLLRVSHSKWYEWSKGAEAGGRSLPPYVQASMEAHLALHRAGLLRPLIERREAERKVRPAR